MSQKNALLKHKHTHFSIFPMNLGTVSDEQVNGFIVIWPKGKSGIQEGGIRL